MILTGIAAALKNKTEEDWQDAEWFYSESEDEQSFHWYCRLIQVDPYKLRERVRKEGKKFRYRASQIFWGTFQQGRVWTRTATTKKRQQ